MLDRQQKTLELKCKLTQEEFNERAKELSAAHIRKSKIERALLDYKAHYKQQLTAVDNIIARLANVVEDSAEYRDVECEEVVNSADLVVETWRLDTNTFYSSRPLTRAEQQTELDLLREEQGRADAESEESETEGADAADDDSPDVKPITNDDLFDDET